MVVEEPRHASIRIDSQVREKVSLDTNAGYNDCRRCSWNGEEGRPSVLPSRLGRREIAEKNGYQEHCKQDLGGSPLSHVKENF